MENTDSGTCGCSAHRMLATPWRSEKAGGTLDVAALRQDFPILQRKVLDRPLIYLDNAATSQKPLQVVDAEADFYRLHNANVHRSDHKLGREATELLDTSRARVAAFIGGAPQEVVFTKNASEAINVLAGALADAGRTRPEFRSLAIGPGDRVVVTEMEHHSNLLPWQDLCRRTGAELCWLPVTSEGRLDLSTLENLVDERCRILAFTQQSNLFGTVNPVDVLVARAKAVGALTLLDACQSVAHTRVDVTALGVDFLAFSGHKMCGPTGIGVLWGRSELLSALPPFMTGGEMADQVSMGWSTYVEPPTRFEAGTPMIAQTIGLAAACTYLDTIGRERIAEHEHVLTGRILDGLDSIKGARIVGPAENIDRGPAVSFSLAEHFPDDIGEFLDRRGIAIRAGHHCARPACLRYGLPATARASSHLYTTEAEVDTFIEALAELTGPTVHAAQAGVVTAALPTLPGRSVKSASLVPPQAPDSQGDAERVFLSQVFSDAATAATGLAVSIGDRLGLYRAMAGAGHLTAGELAERTGTQEIYLREWLHTQVGAGYVTCEQDPSGQSLYLLPDPHSAVLAEPDAPTSGVGIFGALGALYAVENELTECFRTGEGIDWGTYPPRMFKAVARFFRPAYRANIVQNWIPALNGTADRLRQGARVADIGCGVGYSTLLMAQAFPRSTFVGYDYHEPSIDRARIIAEERELDDRVAFHTRPAADLATPDTKRAFDLVTFFNCLHDMGDPLAAARAARDLVKDDGAVMLVELNAEADPTANLAPEGRLFMALSTALCLPAAVAQKGPHSLGNHPGEAALREIAEQAGFSHWRRATDTPRAAVYELRP
ncbi:SufS family cysteine desulfurase [Streptomyces griseus]|uniref:SufS family cysteine desulfurase n=1 Tax=Streptomyces griseus TaxID=1911 RepID=UPI0037D47183